ncbi:MAG: GGDEF domain-containing protein [Spirochaetes bacterium]|nr:GGDEF domain-containing protein [Spirochaetota bacterium]
MRELSNFNINVIKVMTHLLANDVVSDDVMEHLRLLELEYYSIVDKNSLLEEKVNIDNKTNLLKYKDDYLTIILKTASRILDRPVLNDCYRVAYIRFDIDDFSKLNNKFGHDKGDMVLLDLATLIKTNSRPTDYTIRFGGEEFDVMLPATGMQGAIVYLDKIYNEMHKLSYNFDGTPFRVGVSAGVSCLGVTYSRLKKINTTEIAAEYKKLQKEADDALYEAKNTGKNCYKIYDAAIDYKSIREQYAALPGTR